MDALVLSLFLFATFAAGFTTGLAGFALGLVLSGVLLGLTGIIATVWTQLHGWTKVAQSTVLQPVNSSALIVVAVSLAVAGDAITSDTIRLYLVGLPALFIGIWLGLKHYGRLDEAAFRYIVLILLFASGLSLVGRFAWRALV